MPAASVDRLKMASRKSSNNLSTNKVQEILITRLTTLTKKIL